MLIKCLQALGLEKYFKHLENNWECQLFFHLFLEEILAFNYDILL